MKNGGEDDGTDIRGVDDKAGTTKTEECHFGSNLQEERQKNVWQLSRSSLLSVPGKVLTLILLERLQTIIEPQQMEAQSGFREGSGTVDQI